MAPELSVNVADELLVTTMFEIERPATPETENKGGDAGSESQQSSAGDGDRDRGIRADSGRRDDNAARPPSGPPCRSRRRSSPAGRPAGGHRQGRVGGRCDIRADQGRVARHAEDGHSLRPGRAQAGNQGDVMGAGRGWPAVRPDWRRSVGPCTCTRRPRSPMPRRAAGTRDRNRGRGISDDIFAQERQSGRAGRAVIEPRGKARSRCECPNIVADARRDAVDETCRDRCEIPGRLTRAGAPAGADHAIEHNQGAGLECISSTATDNSHEALGVTVIVRLPPVVKTDRNNTA